MGLGVILAIGGAVALWYYTRPNAEGALDDYRKVMEYEIPNMEQAFKKEYEATPETHARKREELEQALGLVEKMKTGKPYAILRSMPHALAFAYKYCIDDIVDPKD
jgi:hypothetical protein